MNLINIINSILPYKKDPYLAINTTQFNNGILIHIKDNQNIQNSKNEKVNHLNEAGQVMKIFDHIIESSKVGLRKPDPKIYYMSCDALGVKPEECIYLDDLGINLKPAREIGMTTIKVIDPNEAINEVKKYLQLA